jgi:hypothetical protein
MNAEAVERLEEAERAFNAAIGSGGLSHDTMTTTTHHVHLLGEVATIDGRGQYTGMFRGSGPERPHHWRVADGLTYWPAPAPGFKFLAFALDSLA